MQNKPELEMRKRSVHLKNIEDQEPIRGKEIASDFSRLKDK